MMGCGGRLPIWSMRPTLGTGGLDAGLTPPYRTQSSSRETWRVPRVRLSRNGQLTIPDDVREAMQLASGDLVNVTVQGNRIVIERVEAERSALETDLLEGCDDALTGRVHGPFAVDEAIAFLRRQR